jgi:hypothetical protein
VPDKESHQIPAAQAKIRQPILPIHKVPGRTLMEAATDINKQSFGKMIAAGIVNGDSVSSQSGEVVFSF